MPTILTSAMRRSAIACIALNMAAGLPAVAEPRVISAKGPVWIRQAEAPLLFEQCSRAAPVPEGKLWFPTAAELKVLEMRLVEYLSMPKLNVVMPESGAQYRGQYAGFERAGVKYIYGSFAPAGMAESWGFALRICDGGPVFWGNVYNPATGEFSELELNGGP